MTSIRTYAVASGPSESSMSEVTASPAMTMENSPRATSAPPARQRPLEIPARRAAQIFRPERASPQGIQWAHERNPF
jgi:hypothetical protein